MTAAVQLHRSCLNKLRGTSFSFLTALADWADTRIWGGSRPFDNVGSIGRVLQPWRATHILQPRVSVHKLLHVDRHMHSMRIG